MNTDNTQPMNETTIESESPLQQHELEALAQPAFPDKPFPCTWPGCDRGFETLQQLRMHRVRMHTHGHTKRSKQTREEKLRIRRIYQRKLRARRMAAGLTSAGHPRIRKLRETQSESAYKRSKYLEQKARYAAQGLNAHGEPFKIHGDKLKKIQEAQRLRRLREAREARGTGKPRGKIKLKLKRLHYVYPLPQTPTPVIEPVVAPADEWIHARLKRCPCCGEDLTRWKYTE